MLTTKTVDVNRITDAQKLLPHVRAALVVKALWHEAQADAARCAGNVGAEKFHRARWARLDAQIRNRIGELAESGTPTMLEIAAARCAYNRETVRREEAALERQMADAARRAKQLVADYDRNGNGHRAPRGRRTKFGRSYAELTAA